MSVVRWNPFREYDDFFTRFAGLPSENVARSEWLPAVDISETAESYLLDVEIPAVAAENVTVAVKDGVLTVSGERNSEETDAKRHRVERQFGRFERSFRLPEGVEEETIEAASKDGVLHLEIKKKPKEKPRQIEVKVH